MDKSTIQTLIDKVIGKKGLIRVPSWWMRKVLMQIADWVQGGDDANDEKIRTVNKKVEEANKEADRRITSLDNNIKAALVELKKSLHTQKCVVVKTGAREDYIIVDGLKQSIPANTQKVVLFSENIKFGRSIGSSPTLTYIGLTVTDMSSITDMSSMFASCSSLTSLDLAGLNASAATTMEQMFYNCSKLTSLDLAGFDASAVTSMTSMFYNCSSLTSLDLTGFDTSAVTSMDGMFIYCYSLTSLILGPNFFKTKSVTSINFSGCFNWVGDTLVTSLVNNSYDRAAAGLGTLTLQLSTRTKAALTDEQKAAITAKGYTIA